MRKIYILLIVIVMPWLANAQDRTLSGIVTSGEDGEPLPGVNILVQGTNRGAVSDINGFYSIQIPPEKNEVVFSFIGYTSKTVTVSEESSVDVVLQPDTKTLDELVVVGYGVQRKRDITGATATVGGSELVKQPVLTATQALQGKVAGVQIISSGQPGASPQIRVRGVGTAIAGTTALFVVDGVLTDDISNINTADILDISVLKDASAAAIYGSRGANGVIIITTRKGTKEGITVNYNNNVGVRQAANVVEMANSEEYRNYAQAATGSVPPSSDYNTDWYDVIIRNAFYQNHNISISGKSERSNYFVNVGYFDEEGIVLNNDFRRFTVRLNEEYSISSKIKLGLQSSFGNSINENAFNNIDIDPFGKIGSVYNNAYRAAPIIPSIVDGRYGNTSAYQNVGNPLLDINNNSVRVNEYRLQGSGFLEVKPFPWLTFRSSIGADWRNWLSRLYNYEFLADEETFVVAGGNQLRPVSALNVKEARNIRWVWDNTVTFSKEYDRHLITLLAGSTAEKYNRHWISANRNEVPPDPNLWYITVGDANTSQNDGAGEAWARSSYLARLNYSFDEKYLLTATIRSDGSSRLPGRNRWQQFPSFGVGWVLSREGFLQGQEIFDFLKLRASYGKVGNDQVPTDAFTRLVVQNKAYPFSGSTTSATNGGQINEFKEPNITWEVTEEYDAAIEFGLLESKLTGEVNYYHKRVDNALIFVPIPRTIYDVSGTVLYNAASIQNQGIEVLLNWKNQVSDNFSYNIGANVTLNRNEVVALNGGQAIQGGSIGAAQGFTTLTDKGEPVGNFHVLQVLGVFNTGDEVSGYVGPDGTPIQPTAKPGDFKYLDKNNDGQIDDNDRVSAGSYQPKAYMGLNFGANYKNWDLSLDIYSNVGNKVYNGKKAVRVDGRDNVEKDIVYNRWTSANRSQTEPGANTGNLPASTYFVESGSFARINNLTIGYTFAEGLLSKLRISNLRVFATSQNLITLQKFTGFTPELPGDPIDSGIELSAYPTTRTVAVGLNVSF